mgnify:CR=1 FL=1
MDSNDIVIGLVGSGGDGVVSAGEILVNAGAGEGLHSFMLKSFGPQIRGGESSCRVRISEEQLFTHGDKVDVLGVFHWKDFKRFRGEMGLKNPLVIIQDESDKMSEDQIPIDESIEKIIYKVPLDQLAKEKAGTSLAKNMVMLGVMSQLFGIPGDGIRRAIRKKFAKKKQKVTDSNIAGFEAGADYVKENITKSDSVNFTYKPAEPKVVMEGNEAIAYGAFYAGCRFFAGYPITPSSEVMEWMGRELPKYGGSMLQAEDELAAIGMIIGASFAGKKAMTATSGPGLSLMSEQIGLASIAELPIVIVDVQRGGPSTGIPTKTEQSDLMQALYGTHGDANRVVLAPVDVADCFDVTMEAFYIAEKYQIPVIVLSDQYLGHRKETFESSDLIGNGNGSGKGFKKKIERVLPSDEEKENYQRFKMTDTGVSPITYPGIKGGMYQAAGIEHDEYGLPSSDTELHAKMDEKRYKKNQYILEEIDFVRYYGPEDAEIGVLGWGSSKGAIKEAVLKLNKEGYSVKAAIPQALFPLATDKMEKFVHSVGKTLVVELSYTGQFHRYLTSMLDLNGKKLGQYARSGGSPLSVEEIYNRIKQEFE